MTRMFAYTPILMDATKRILVCKEPAVILEGRTRFWTVGLGKGCALSVLLMSLSNQMSLLTGIEYFDTASFFCASPWRWCWSGCSNHCKSPWPGWP